ncbi:MAG TPA: bifunctional 4-hydroxy-3-methylbut-2-enyl diphosphate reductase/30S ribosomal protein S1 [Firmicutes bacterium]|jgi:4-hydroxy-3-methylbut-2-enyl diphosphate reductase|nr:bifunctional 4-hydroxy-3-methylbut-2-enyl diphosphate reductase/30S ribosomal protein S1 [Bacillota bacterium]HAZ23200.1 bifunctional 4-hydroxy-3-methylbut-2-enyl diphosphate reductase/30S ribosomal protein S1 [Bacillota bacterium]HBE07271.1 bifunctional 4-hydroxy-3-methylbut-2-enyl diphosphate reductase/30S ribosomal protein S1 [Bacillota bacterium]HBL51523.1 bifunctional 4-hydroxy-3-methylbut-2-enyl diphosphate reductase/30S ribosomal protein S1 [Bacillota bacterium]HBL68606.1 bifunctional
MNMNIHIADKAGFCFGVKRALDIVQDVLKEGQGPVCTLGPLIHNPRVVKELSDQGVRVIDDPVSAEAGIMVIRSHGATRDEVERAVAKGLKVVDATCPCLKQAQKRANELCGDGYYVVLLGEREHAEVRSILGSVDGTIHVIESTEEAKALQCSKKVALLSQTTQRYEDFQEVACALLPKTREFLIVNTICNATVERQNAAEKMAKKVDVMVVIGGRNSANTARLFEICRSTGTPAYQIESAAELKPEWFAGAVEIGLTAGASTPQGQIEEVVNRMMEIDEQGKVKDSEQQEVVPEEVASEGGESMAGYDFEKEYGRRDIRHLEENEIVKAHVVQVRDDMVFVDVGTKSELAIPLADLTAKDVMSAKEVVAVGDVIDVLVLRAADEDKIKLSARQAAQQTVWLDLNQHYRDHTPVQAKVKEVVKGGLIADLAGVRAFIPASQIDRGFVEDLSKFIGETCDFMITELEEGRRRRVVLSRRAILDAQYEENKKEIFASLQEGDVKEGVVSRLADFGAFVDLGKGVEGLLHISEISWERLKHPAERLSAGMKVKVEVTKVDTEKGRISLSMRSLSPHPWEGIAEKYSEGQVVSGTVTRIAPFGAFVRIEEGIEGLIHISQLSNQRVAKAEEVVSPGQTVQAKIIKVDPENRRLSLSMREAVQPSAEEVEYQKYMQPESAPVTIADMIKDKEE